jgi:hypothetical protein
MVDRFRILRKLLDQCLQLAELVLRVVVGSPEVHSNRWLVLAKSASHFRVVIILGDPIPQTPYARAAAPDPAWLGRPLRVVASSCNLHNVSQPELSGFWTGSDASCLFRIKAASIS